MLWQLSGARRLGERATAAMGEAAELAFSVVSFAEIGVKAAIGKLTVPEDFHAHVLASGLGVIGLSPDHGLAVARPPLHHRDPFGRPLIAQAREERLTVVSADPRIRAYDVPVIDPLT